MGFKESARKTAQSITKGFTDPHHLGKMSIEVIDQEIYSFENTKPAFRDVKFFIRVEKVIEQIKARLSRNERSIICQVQLNRVEKMMRQS